MTTKLTRRAFVETSGLAGRVMVAGTTLRLNPSALAQTAQATPAIEPVAASELDLTLRVNGAAHAVTVDPRTTLLDALRERLDLTGTKKGCDIGACTSPWRLRVVEDALIGTWIGDLAAWNVAVEKSTIGAHPLANNTFKIELAKRTILRALRAVAAA
jgi:hypothetical protein